MILTFPWWIRAWWLIRGTMVHQNHPKARIHHDNSSGRHPTVRSGISVHIGNIVADQPAPNPSGASQVLDGGGDQAGSGAGELSRDLVASFDAADAVRP